MWSGPLHVVNAQKSSKKGGNSGNILSGPSCSGASAGGCVIATGGQVAEPFTVDTATDSFSQLPSISAYARLTFEFNSAFTQMKYTTEVYDANNASPTFNVQEAALVCGFVGEGLTDNELDSSVIAFLQFKPTGAPLDNQILTANDLLAIEITPGNTRCGLTNISTVAALYQAMLDEQVFFYVSVIDQFNRGLSFVRGQIYLPQGGFLQ
jgi:hypothetical protein